MEVSGGKRSPARLVGAHPSLIELDRAIAAVAPLEAAVLILGESGTGKELVARAIHDRSARRDEPFLAVNCGAFAAGLLESQLFGHVRGAFTGAVEDRPGVFHAAGRGTLFLDEIAEMEPELQARLLRALEAREVVPVGANIPVPFEARFLAATNRDLEADVRDGRFRRDLYYRLRVLELRVPPLRERIEDVPALVEHFLEELSRGGARRTISDRALERLLRHRYPGNVRELRNALERACALARSPVIEPEDLPPELRCESEGAREHGATSGFLSLAQMERQHIVRALRMAEGRKSTAARFLQVDRNRLSRLMKRHGIGAREDRQADSELG